LLRDVGYLTLPHILRGPLACQRGAVI
jgi:hypothetical protein